MKTFQVVLGGKCVSLRSDSIVVIEAWSTVFGEVWREETAVSPISLTLDLVEQLPAWPAQFDFQESVSGLGVVRQEDGVALYFAAGAYCFVPNGSDQLHGQIVADCLPHIEEITYTFLASAYRRHGQFLIHAFAAKKNSELLLLIAPSGGGKTTTGLALLQHGYRLVANDTAVLTQADNTISAHAVPEMIHVRQNSFALLGLPSNATAPLPTTQFLQAHGFESATAGAITAVYFLDLKPELPCEKRPFPKPIALAKLLEASVDRWDKASLTAHTAFLTQLCERADMFQLRIGYDMKRVWQVIEEKRLTVNSQQSTVSE